MAIKVLGLPGRAMGHACTDYRLTYPWRALGKQLDSHIAIVTDLTTISQYDLVVFQRQEMPLVEEVIRATQQAAGATIRSPWMATDGLAWNDATRIEAAHRTGKPCVFDIDDDALHVPDTNPNYLQWGRDARKIAQILDKWQGPKPEGLQKPAAMVAAQARANLKQLLANIKAADAVTVTTPWLAEVYRPYNSRIYILPNWAEPREWEHVKPKAHDGIHIGWAGGPTHYADLAVVAQPLRQILQEFPQTRLVLAGFPALRQLLFADVSEKQIITYPFMAEWKHNLATFDIILAPSADNKFNRGKSAIRIFEGLLATHGQAAVVGSETTYGQAIRQLGCGYVCKSFRQWHRALQRLVEDETLRRELGAQGYERMMESHTYERNAEQWLRAYQEVLCPA